ncbi:MAG: hypothetical protein MMC33_000143 [Icmadophila ericetorum]|nr:hypothetical protein [Icmadophila ericetorum]
MAHPIAETLRMKIGQDARIARTLLQEYEEALNVMQEAINFIPMINDQQFTRSPTHPLLDPTASDTLQLFNSFLGAIEHVAETRIFNPQNMTYASVLARQELHSVIKDTQSKDWEVIEELVLIKVYTVADFWFRSWCMTLRELRNEVQGMLDAVDAGQGYVGENEWR